MSQSEVDRFVKDLKADTGLQAEVKAKSIDAIVTIAIAHGYSVSAEELRASVALTADEEDLGHVAGELLQGLNK